MLNKKTNQAVWSADTEFRPYPTLSGDIDVDVAIVGGGICGISTAYLLSRAGLRVAVLEAKQVGSGTTGSSTGNLYEPTGERLYNIRSKHGEEGLKDVVHSRRAAMDFIEGRIKEHKLDCAYEPVSWYLFTEAGASTSEHEQVEKEYKAAEQAGLAASRQTASDFPFQSSALLALPGQAQFNSLRYVQGLAAAIAGENCLIYENSPATRIEDGSPANVHTAQGKVRAKKVVQATHSPKGIYVVHTAMEVYREAAIAVRLKGSLPKPGIYWHLHDNQQYSVRPYSSPKGDFLIALGQSNKLGHQEHTEEKFTKLEAYLRHRFDIEQVVYRWAAQNYQAADGLPYIGTSPTESQVYIATGFAADGLVYGTLAAQLISDAILGEKNPWQKRYDPKRFTPLASAKRFMKENVDVATHMLKDYLLKSNEKALDAVQAGEGKIVEVDSQKLAAYRDPQGKLHVVSAVCTHAGCMVHWNAGEVSWDCPCHGSRFSIDGDVLEGPAYTALSKKDVS